MNVSEILASHRPRVQRVSMMFNGDLADQISRARQEYRSALAQQSTLSSTDVDDLKTRLDELEQQADSETVEFVFQAISKADLDALKHRFPPSEDTWDRYKTRLAANPLLSPPEFDPEPFSAALIAATAVEPSMTEDEANQLLERLSDGDFARLFEAAWTVSMQGSDRPLSRTSISGT